MRKFIIAGAMLTALVVPSAANASTGTEFVSMAEVRNTLDIGVVKAQEMAKANTLKFTTTYQVDHIDAWTCSDGSKVSRTQRAMFNRDLTSTATKLGSLTLGYKVGGVNESGNVEYVGMEFIGASRNFQCPAGTGVTAIAPHEVKETTGTDVKLNGKTLKSSRLAEIIAAIKAHRSA